ncbi:MAG TPA: hypothetical protein VE007_10595 [Thermoanaerobaculia bacterium]|nr:hypothetical protein [Thermoanaerobaculia bacterium]
MKPPKPGSRPGSAPAPNGKTARCDRCSKFEPLFAVEGKRICVACFELNLAGLERREPSNESRGFGRRFQDGVNSDWSSTTPRGPDRTK